mmetsp:Transcript_7334/g.22974  ORF Transcript_7334/g.22974 Transcript_7334/m.22974 type:complete len:557 (+) Transcript_7334:122-1792(+)
MGGLDVSIGRPLATQNVVAPLLSNEMEHIRKVFDEDAAGKKLSSIFSPREDALMFRSTDKHTVQCECIVELYELLWRWGHRNTDNRSFASNFGFAIPDTIVIVKGKPYAWYFISRKDGSLLRKSEGSMTLQAMEKKFCRDRGEDEAASPVCAVWLPMASQFPEARCHSPNADFLSTGACRHFLGSLRATHSGVLQAFVDPHGVSNFLVRTVQFRDQTSLCTRTNRALLAQGRGNLFDRAATFEGWEGLSSSSSRYRSHRHPHMEELILAAGETLNRRIEQERVRQMLFLNPDQHVALHFKVTKDHMLFFIYASVVAEKEVILQTRPQLLMGDACMTEDLPGAALLPGGTDRKAPPHEVPVTVRLSFKSRTANVNVDSPDEAEAAEGRRQPQERTLRERTLREGSLPPIWQPARPQSDGDAGGRSARRRPLSERRRTMEAKSVLDASVLPRMGYARPEVPEAPYRFHQTPHSLEEAGRYEYMPPFLGADSIKRPLVDTGTARSEPPLTARARPPQPPASERRPSSARRRERQEAELPGSFISSDSPSRCLSTDVDGY